jgi:L-fuculose-phosphate aldolase
MRRLREEVRVWSQRLFERRLVSGWGGNVSCRAGENRFLITAQHAPLGFLTPADIVAIDGSGRPLDRSRRPSSETALHLAVYRATEAGAVIHAHPPRVVAFSLGSSRFVPLSFEEKYTLGEIPVLPQDTPTVTALEPVVEALAKRPVAILRGHGTVAIGRDLKEAFLLTDLLEEAVRCRSLAGVEPAAGEPPPEQRAKDPGPPLFSPEHVSRMVELANADREFREQGKQGGLSTTLTLAVDGDGARWTVRFHEGEISEFRAGGEGEFVIAANRDCWREVFQGRLDPFLATQQGKLKLVRGDMWKLSRWFKPFSRAFRLWQALGVA